MVPLKGCPFPYIPQENTGLGNWSTAFSSFFFFHSAPVIQTLPLPLANSIQKRQYQKEKKHTEGRSATGNPKWKQTTSENRQTAMGAPTTGKRANQQNTTKNWRGNPPDTTKHWLPKTVGKKLLLRKPPANGAQMFVFSYIFLLLDFFFFIFLSVHVAGVLNLASDRSAPAAPCRRTWGQGSRRPNFLRVRRFQNPPKETLPSFADDHNEIHSPTHGSSSSCPLFFFFISYLKNEVLQSRAPVQRAETPTPKMPKTHIPHFSQK